MARRVAVAASGGRDSTALLHATCRAARELGIEVVALHVHHGLMPQADAWAAQVRRQCLRWARSGLPVHCVVQRLEGGPSRGDSVEAWARRERYRVLTAMAVEQGAPVVLLAHHRQDQAETVLLQALRGAGPAGLSAMPRCAQRGGILWCRPWLDRPRVAIEAYVRRYRLRHVEDDSNHDPRFVRSRLRRRLWPDLMEAFPGAETSLCHAAARAQEAAACLHEVAELDQGRCVTTAGDLRLDAWSALSAARRANLLRHWLAVRAPDGVPDSLIARLSTELARARSGARWPAGDGELQLHRGTLKWAALTGAIGGTARALDLSVPGEHELADWRGRFVVRPAGIGEAGVEAELLRKAEIRARTPGLQFQRGSKTPPRSLKKAYQEAGVGLGARAVPLVFAEGRLVFVPGLGVDARVAADETRARLHLTWKGAG